MSVFLFAVQQICQTSKVLLQTSVWVSKKVHMFMRTRFSANPQFASEGANHDVYSGWRPVTVCRPDQNFYECPN